jgi:hypothetical protein
VGCSPDGLPAIRGAAEVMDNNPQRVRGCA